MHKQLLLLAFLTDHPLTGYEIQKLVLAHGDLYADLKKGNVYYLLGRMAADGLVSVKVVRGARGPRGERLVYSLTRNGRQQMLALLRTELETYEAPHTGIEVAMALVDQLPRAEVRRLLTKRLEKVESVREQLRQQLGGSESHPGSAAEHLLMMADAERTWLERAIAARGPSPKAS